MAPFERRRGSLEDLKSVAVQLRRLTKHNEKSCPVSRRDVEAYVHGEEESGSGYHARIGFLRTATIGEASYWIWQYRNEDDEENYALVVSWRDASPLMECDWTFGLTPEQFILAHHYRLDELDD